MSDIFLWTHRGAGVGRPSITYFHLLSAYTEWSLEGRMVSASGKSKLLARLDVDDNTKNDDDIYGLIYVCVQ